MKMLNFAIYILMIKKEVKRDDKYVIKEGDNTYEIKIIIDYQFNSFRQLCGDCSIIEMIHFKKFLRKNITDMSRMFNQCSSLKEIIFSSFNTHNITDMTGMFYECSSLKQLNLSKFNTYNVIYMSCMFYGCSSLEKINLSNFNTDKVKICALCFLNAHH